MGEYLFVLRFTGKGHFRPYITKEKEATLGKVAGGGYLALIGVNIKTPPKMRFGELIKF